MRNVLLTWAMAGVILVAGGVARGQDTRNYGDVTLSGGFQAGHFPQVWDLTCGTTTISFAYDANGLVDDFGGDAHAWAELGVRQVGYGDFNPTWMTGGAGVWLATDYHWAANTFDPDPPGAPTLDIDDKLILQRGGGMDESYYNLPSAPPNPWANHAVWFDRDGVDQWQAQMWGAVDGVTYNTGGTYDVVITLEATGPTSGTAYMTVNGRDQGFYDPGWDPEPAELMPAGMTFTGDMTQMQVFYGLYGYGATHTVTCQSITVEGCLYEFPVDVDVKPGSDPNSINLGSHGLIPVAILSTETFDALQVDPDTVELDGAGVAVRGKAEKLMAQEEDVNGDGLMDLLLHVETESFAPDVQSGQAILTGFTYDGNPIQGMDAIVVVPPQPAPEPCSIAALALGGLVLLRRRRR